MSSGHGRVGKARKHPGGRGNAGGLTHRRQWYDRFHPGYFGKIGMRTMHRIPHHDHSPMVNIDSLWALVGQKAYEEAKNRKDGKAIVIDVVQHGYFKVGGRGEMPKVPVIVRAKFFSQLSEHKIREAGGICELRS